MPETKKLGEIIGALKTELTPDCAAIATHIGVRRQFIYALRDDTPELPRDENRARVATAAEDPRYIALDALCKTRGITGLFDAVETTLHQKRTQPVRFDRVELRSACHVFGNRIEDAGGMNDAEVSRLYIEICQRINIITR